MFDEAAKVTRWQRLCCVDEFAALNPAGTYISECCQSLLIDSAVCIFCCVWLSLLVDSAMRRPSAAESGARRTSAARWCVYSGCLALLTCLCSLAVLLSVARQWCLSRYWASAVQSVGWLFCVLVARGGHRRPSRRHCVQLCTCLLLLTFLSVSHVLIDSIALLSHTAPLRRVVLPQLACHCVRVVAACACLLSCLLLLLPATPSQPSSQLPAPPLGTAEQCSWWLVSWLTMSWVTPLMRRGRRITLTSVNHLFQLPVSLRADVVNARFSSCMRRSRARSPSRAETTAVISDDQHDDTSVLVTSRAATAEESQQQQQQQREKQQQEEGQAGLSLVRVVLRCFGVEYALLGLLKFTADMCTFAGPLLLNAILTVLDDESCERPLSRGLLYSSLIMLSSVAAAVAVTQYDYLMDRAALKMRSAFISAVYRKALRVRLADMSDFSSGQLVTFISVDCDRVSNMCTSLHAFWSLPLQFGVALFLLDRQVGVACVAGLVFALVLVPLNKYISNWVGVFSAGMLKHKDKRVHLMSQLLHHIETVKMSGWQRALFDKVTVRRHSELSFLRRQKYLDAWCVFFWATTPVIMSLLTFGTYVLLGHQLTAPIVFTTIALMNMLKNPINAFPWALNGLVDSLVSLRRVQAFLSTADFNPTHYYLQYNSPAAGSADDVVIMDGCFSWRRCDEDARDTMADDDNDDNDDGVFALRQLNLTLRRGSHVGVLGDVGSGKSSLLYAIAGEMHRHRGSISVADSVALVTQNAWLQEASVRDNIVFGAHLDQHWYTRVLEACDLLSDLTSLPQGDCTLLVQGGANISGGQRARVCLARAVYQRRRLVLLDDVFSSLDPAVARHVMHHCVDDLLRDSTVLLCGHCPSQLLDHMHWLLMMQHGRIVRQGAACQLLQTSARTSETDLNLCTTSSSTATTNSHSQGDVSAELAVSQSNTVDDSEQEARAEGSISSHVLVTYWSAVGRCLAPVILLVVVCMQISRNACDMWLAFYVTADVNSSSSTNNTTAATLAPLVAIDDNTVSRFFVIYGAMAAINGAVALLRSFLFAYGGLRAATVMHQQLLTALLQAGVSFVSGNRVGRILNRFSSDVNTVDDSLPFIINILLAQMSGLIGILVVSAVGVPWILVIYVPLAVIYYYLQDYYRHTSRELKRLSSVSLSPVYAHFIQSLNGLAVIRTLNASDRLMMQHMHLLDCNQRAMFCLRAAAGWLNVRLQMIGVVMLTGVTFISVTVRHLTDHVHTGLVGLSISYALSITGSLNAVVSAFTETEKEFVSVERIKQYMDVERECESDQCSHSLPDMPDNWPTRGHLEFRDVTMIYRGCTRAALSGVSVVLSGGRSLAVVGRTGAGKSSLLSALLRLHPITSGQILLDGQSVHQVDLLTLRRSVCVLPQRAFVFSGTVRENIDPCNCHTDEQVWSVIERCHLRDSVSSLDQSVDTSDGGAVARVSLLSAGQCQLVCIARVLLNSDCKLLCVDEPTANVDHHTHTLIQEALRKHVLTGSGRSLVVVSHRSQSLLSWCDLVMVLCEGRVVELAPPTTLLHSRHSALNALFANERCE